jgi:hypothetical protein
LSPALALPNTQTDNKIQSQELLDLLAAPTKRNAKQKKLAKKAAATKQ